MESPATLTPGNVDDRAPVPQFAARLFGKLFGDKGYMSQPLLKQLKSVFGMELITPRRKNMKKVELPLLDKLYLRKRAIVETIDCLTRTGVSLHFMAQRAAAEPHQA